MGLTVKMVRMEKMETMVQTVQMVKMESRPNSKSKMIIGTFPTTTVRLGNSSQKLQVRMVKMEIQYSRLSRKMIRMFILN